MHACALSPPSTFLQKIAAHWPSFDDLDLGRGELVLAGSPMDLHERMSATTETMHQVWTLAIDLRV